MPLQGVSMDDDKPSLDVEELPKWFPTVAMRKKGGARVRKHSDSELSAGNYSL